MDWGKDLARCHSEMASGDGKSGQWAMVLSQHASTSNPGYVEGQEESLPRNRARGLEVLLNRSYVLRFHINKNHS